jgi:hypothetical protein
MADRRHGFSLGRPGALSLISFQELQQLSTHFIYLFHIWAQQLCVSLLHHDSFHNGQTRDTFLTSPRPMQTWRAPNQDTHDFLPK